VTRGASRRPVVRLRPRGHRTVADPALNGAGSAPAILPRGLIVLLGTAGAVVVLAGMRGVAGLLGPVFLALMLTVTVSPLGTWLRRHGWPVWTATLATVTAVYAILLGLGGALAVSVAQLIKLMPTYQDQFASLQADLATFLGSLGVDQDQVRGGLEKAVTPSTVTQAAEWVFGGVTSALTNAFFLLAVVLFMCLDGINVPARLSRITAERPQIVQALTSFSTGTRRYLVVSTVFGLIVAVIDTLMLWALGIPLPILWGLLAFITNYIPNIGFVIGLVPPALLALLDGGVSEMVTVIVLYSVVNMIIQSVIQPKIVGDQVGLSTTVSFLSLVFWAWVLGPLGALLAIPMSLLAKGLLVDIDPSTRWINALLAGGAPEPLPDEQSSPVSPAPAKHAVTPEAAH
jgi:AI-2 transport protein TqsA